MDKNQYAKSQYKQDIKEIVHACESLRRDPEGSVDVSIAEFVNQKYGISMETLYEDLGLNASIDTIQNIFMVPDESVRWLVPEIIRDALTLGLRKAPIYSEIIAAEQTIAQPSITIPHLNMSEAVPHYLGEAETIPKGMISYGHKTLKIRKMGRGISIPYEVQQYVTINVLAIFLQDFGVKLNHAIDALMIDVLINGEQSDGSESAPVIGVAVVGSMAYIDLLKIWVRMSRIGRQPFGIIGGETAAIETLNLDEFKVKQNAGPTEKVLDLRTPIPATSAYFIHGAMPANQQMVVDRTGAIIKYNAQPLLIENEKIVSNQTLATYASLTTGFGILYRDARIIIDDSILFSGNGFPSYMEVDALESVTIPEKTGVGDLA